MSQPLPIPPPGFEKLSHEEQIEYVEALLDFIDSQAEAKIPEWHWKILRERLADSSEDLENGKTWEEFEQELEQELMQR